MGTSDKEVRDAIAKARESFERAILRAAFSGASASDPDRTGLIAETRAEFDRIVQRVAESGDYSEVEKSAWALARMRAYILPLAEVRGDARSIQGEMADWGVPDDVVTRLACLVREAQGTDLARARAALHQLYFESDYWDGYVDWWNDQLKLAAVIGAPLTLATLVGSFIVLSLGLVVPGIVVAGASGAGLSVLLRLPRLAVYGRLADFWIRATGRYLSGTLAAVLGFALLQTGILAIPMAGGGSIAATVQQCSSSCGPASEVLLFGVALALGFSERLISSMTGSLVGSANRRDLGSGSTANSESVAE